MPRFGKTIHYTLDKIRGNFNRDSNITREKSDIDVTDMEIQ